MHTYTETKIKGFKYVYVQRSKAENTGDLKQKADFDVLKSTNQPSIYFHLKTGTLIFLSLNLMSYFLKKVARIKGYNKGNQTASTHICIKQLRYLKTEITQKSFDRCVYVSRCGYQCTNILLCVNETHFLQLCELSCIQFFWGH